MKDTKLQKYTFLKKIVCKFYSPKIEKILEKKISQKVFYFFDKKAHTTFGKKQKMCTF
jgi:hypothetical protein